jgi:hypothetical protein
MSPNLRTPTGDSSPENTELSASLGAVITAARLQKTTLLEGLPYSGKIARKNHPPASDSGRRRQVSVFIQSCDLPSLHAEPLRDICRGQQILLRHFPASFTAAFVR